jgi:hypothetical protein
MKTLIALLVISWSISFPVCAQKLPVSPQSPPPLPAEVQALEQKVLAEIEAKANKPYQAALADLNKKYIETLERARVPAEQRGLLDEALAISEEAKGIEAGGSVPIEDDSKTPASLKRLRPTYRKALERLKEEREQRIRPLADAHAASLTRLVTQFTKEGRLAEAAAVRSHVGQLQTELSKDVSKMSTLESSLAGTTWLWYGSKNNPLTFLPDGTVGMTDWSNKGLVPGWKVVGEKEVELRILKGRDSSLTAQLVFADDRRSFTGTDFNGKSQIPKSPRAQ